MLSTQQVLEALRQANPKIRITMNQIRWRLRDMPRGSYRIEKGYGGRLTWKAPDIKALAEALGLRAPSLRKSEREK